MTLRIALNLEVCMPYKDATKRKQAARESMQRKRGTNNVLTPEDVNPDKLTPVTPRCKECSRKDAEIARLQGLLLLRGVEPIAIRTSTTAGHMVENSRICSKHNRQVIGGWCDG